MFYKIFPWTINNWSLVQKVAGHKLHGNYLWKDFIFLCNILSVIHSSLVRWHIYWALYFWWGAEVSAQPPRPRALKKSNNNFISQDRAVFGRPFPWSTATEVTSKPNMLRQGFDLDSGCQAVFCCAPLLKRVMEVQSSVLNFRITVKNILLLLLQADNIS